MRTFEENPVPDFTVEKDGDIFVPPLVTKLNGNSITETQRLTDGCGNREERTINSDNWQIDAEGLMLIPDLHVLAQMNLRESRATLTLPGPFSGEYIIADVTWTFTDEINQAEFPNRRTSTATSRAADDGDITRGQALSWQLQTKDPESNGGL